MDFLIKNKTPLHQEVGEFLIGRISESEIFPLNEGALSCILISKNSQHIVYGK